MNIYDNPEFHAFVNAIRQAPDDDLPRLICADWLEENGEAERAELIRVQCEIDAIPISQCDSIYPGCAVSGNKVMWHDHKCKAYQLREREDDLLQYFGDRKLPPLDGWPVYHSRNPEVCVWFRGNGDSQVQIEAVLHRGFLDSVRMPADQWIAHTDDLLRMHPVRRVTLTYTETPTGDIIQSSRHWHKWVLFWFADGSHVVFEERELLNMRVAGPQEMARSYAVLIASKRWPGIEFTFEKIPQYAR